MHIFPTSALSQLSSSSCCQLIPAMPMMTDLPHEHAKRLNHKPQKKYQLSSDLSFYLTASSETLIFVSTLLLSFLIKVLGLE